MGRSAVPPPLGNAPGDRAEVDRAPGAPLDSRRDRTATDGFGTYWRDPAGIWRYTADDDVVPGASDLLLRDLYDPAVGDADAKPVRLVPRAWASRHPDHPLAWVFEHAELGGRGVIAVPAKDWAERADEVAGMAAPEVHPRNLMGVDLVAQLLGVTAPTVRAYLARDQMPSPVARIGGSPVWSRPVIERWAPGRRAKSPTPRAQTRLVEAAEDAPG